MLAHDFISIARENIPEKMDYEMFRGNAVQVPDEYILDNISLFEILHTHWEYVCNENRGLAYHGITIIPCDELDVLIQILKAIDNNQSIDRLICLCEYARGCRRDVIHWGI